MKRISMIKLASIIEGKDPDFEVIDVKETGYNERSMHIEYSFDVIFKTIGGKTPYIVEIKLDFHLESEQWHDEGYGGGWFEEYDEENPEGIKVFEAEEYSVITYRKKTK